MFSLSVQCTSCSSHLVVRLPKIGEQGTAGSYSSACVCVCVCMCTRSDQIKARSPSKGLAQTEQRVAIPFIFTRLQGHSCIVHTNTLQHTPVIKLKLGKVTSQICISSKQQGGKKRKYREGRRNLSAE